MNLRSVLALLVGVGLLGLVVGDGRAAGPTYWDWPSDRSFAELELAGTALNEDGQVMTGLSARTLGGNGPEVFWQATPDGRGGYYAASGHGGEIHHLTAGGQSSLVTRLDFAEIFSLLVLPDGELLAGGGPDGGLYRVDSRGQADLVGAVDGYVWSQVYDPARDVVWVAGGGPGALYRYDVRRGELALQANLPVENVMALHWSAAGGLLLATQGPGLIYRQLPGRELELLGQTDQDEARTFIDGPDGEVFLLALESGGAAPAGGATSGAPSGGQSDQSQTLLTVFGSPEQPKTAPSALYHVGRDGGVEMVWSSRRALMTAVWSARWGWLGGGEVTKGGDQSVVWQLLPPQGTAPLARWAGGDVINLLVPDPAGDKVVVCQAHPGAVTGLTRGEKRPHAALSPPLDGGRKVHWGRLRWLAEGQGDKLRWSVRAGNRSEPDESWTEWSGTWSRPDQALDVPPSRFLQWRVEFPAATDRPEAPLLTEVSVSAWQDNLPPVIGDFQLEYLQDVTLGGMLSGSENVTQRFRSGLQAEFSRNARPDKWAGPARGALGRSVRVFTWQGTDPNGDRILYRLEYRRRGDETWRAVDMPRPGKTETSETLASWDTSEVPDGVYDMRLVASDRLDNPAGLAASSQRVLGPIEVDNTAPEISGLRASATATGFVVRCKVTDASTVLAGARLRLPDGSVERVDPVDRICDSRSEEFAVEVNWPRAGVAGGAKPWLVHLEVRDLAGNVRSVESEVQ